MSRLDAHSILGDLVMYQVLQDDDDTYYCDWCNASAALIDEVEHSDGCLIGRAQAVLADAAPETDAVGAALRVKCPSCETDVTGAWATGADECPQGCDWPFDAVHLVFEWGDDVQAFIAAIQSIYPERYRVQQPTEQGR